MGKTKTNKTSLAIAGPPVSEDDFKSMIRSAEKGPFASLQETAQIIEKWKLKYVK